MSHLQIVQIFRRKLLQFFPLELFQLRHPQELLTLVLGVDRLKLAALLVEDDAGHLADDGDQLLVGVGGVVLQGGGPTGGHLGPWFQKEEGEVESGRGHDGGTVVDHVVLHDGGLHQVLGQHVLQHVHVASLGIPAEEMQWQRPAEAKVDRAQNPDLQGPDLWGVHLLHLAGYQHGRHTDQLEFVAPNGEALNLEKPVYDGNRHVQGLLEKLELEVNLGQPVQQDTAHLAVDGTTFEKVLFDGRLPL